MTGERWRCAACGWAENVREDGPVCDNCGVDARTLEPAMAEAEEQGTDVVCGVCGRTYPLEEIGPHLASHDQGGEGIAEAPTITREAS